MREALQAVEDASPLVAWPGAEVRRYRDTLHFMRPLERLSQPIPPLLWQGEAELALPGGAGVIRTMSAQGQGVARSRLQGVLCELRFRVGGERLQPAGRQGHHALKKLYQEAGVPPWERERRPLLYVGGQLAQVPGLWTAAEFTAAADEEGVLFAWLPRAIEKELQNDDN
jgi:tRNA(Ile)-lysidine synthase